MSGHVLFDPPIAVDFWKQRNCSHVRLFFLTHMHADHTEGLTPSWSQDIYCSDITRLLVLDKFKLKPDRVHGLVLHESRCLRLGEKTDETLTVMPFIADHCPGAVMFLFEGYFGRILYTGDFRYKDSMNGIEAFSRIWSPPVDKLYLDNTFCSPRCDFPLREKATSAILRIIEAHPYHRVVIGMRKLGKELLLVAIARHFGTQIFVTEERLHRLELLRMPKVFTTVASETRISAMDQEQVNYRNMDAWNEAIPTIAIIPTGLYVVLEIVGTLKRDDVFVVPYSDHSSYAELREFVYCVGPREVIPIVTSVRDRLGKAIPERADMSCFAEYLEKSPSLPFCPPAEFAAVKKDVARDRPQPGSGRGKRDQMFTFRRDVHPKGVVYEQASGDKQRKSLAPLAVSDVTVGNAAAGTNKDEAGNCKSRKRVEENTPTATDETNAKLQRICLLEGADVSNRTSAQSQHKNVLRGSKAGGFSFCKASFEPALASVPLSKGKTRGVDSKKLAGNQAMEHSDSLNIEDYSDTDVILLLEATPDPKCEGRSSAKEAGNDIVSFESCFPSDPDIYLPSTSSGKHKDLRCTDGGSKRRLANEIIVIDDVSETGVEKTVPLDKRGGILNCTQGRLFLKIDDVNRNSVAEGAAVTQQPLGNSDFNNGHDEDDLFVMSDGEITSDVSHEQLRWSDLMLQCLEPVFAAEAKNMFQNFLRAQEGASSPIPRGRKCSRWKTGGNIS